MNGIIHVVRTQNFPKSWHFLPPDTHTYICVSGGKKCYFFGKFCVHNKWMISKLSDTLSSSLSSYDFQPIGIWLNSLLNFNFLLPLKLELRWIFEWCTQKLGHHVAHRPTTKAGCKKRSHVMLDMIMKCNLWWLWILCWNHHRRFLIIANSKAPQVGMQL